MNAPNPLEPMEAFLSTVPNGGDAFEIPRELFPKEPEIMFKHNYGTDAGIVPAVAAPEMQQGDFHTLWQMAHSGIGGYVRHRTGSPCDLGEIADNKAGKAASAEIFQMIQKSPWLTKILNNVDGGIMGTAYVLFLHGQNCRAAIANSAAGVANSNEELDND